MFMNDEFVKMRDKLANHFAEMTKDESHLFEVEVDKDRMWELYLSSFPNGTNNLFRERTDHDCSCCRQFIKNLGNVVVIKDNEIETIWDFDSDSTTYQPVLNALSSYIKEHVVIDIYVSKIKKIGTLENFEELSDGKIIKWSHFYVELPDKFVDKTYRSEGDIKGTYRDVRNVFKRGLEEITEDAILTVMDLISSNTLYKGAEWKNQISDFYKHKKEYMKLTRDSEKENYTWIKTSKISPSTAKIKNTSIGTLLINISEGMELDLAVRKYEEITAPSNYKRSKPIFTQKMLEDAQKKITELGYLDSLGRRHAKLDDITVNNILFSNRDTVKRTNGALDIFGEMKREVTNNPKKFSKVEEITIEKFIEDVLPNATDLELYLENKHVGNMVSLIAPVNKESKTMFKWDNNFCWAYAGNMTDSMKERVKAAGGKVDGDLRFSIQWNDMGEHSRNDLDAHCICPNGNRISFMRKKDYVTSGMLDVDIQIPQDGIPAVENITWADRKTMIPGTYNFMVHQYSNRGGKDGFRAEIEFDGQIYSFDYSKELRNKEYVDVAEVTLDSKGNFTIKELLPSSVSSREVWSVKTNQFIPVSVAMYSPNWWDGQVGIGHKHVFFMLKNCINNENPNGFYNEYLNQELYQHRKVMEALGSKLHVQDSDEQLSGVGFSTTKRDEVVLKVKGNTERIFKVKF